MTDPEEGDVSVVVAPVARFADIGFNADVRLETLVGIDALIAGFAPELIGAPLGDGDVVSQEAVKRGDLTYYMYEIKCLAAVRSGLFCFSRAFSDAHVSSASQPHLLVAATAFKNRLFILTARATPRQWRHPGAEEHVRATANSFVVSTA